MKKLFLLLALSSFFSLPLFSQTQVIGTIVDADSGEPLAFVNIVYNELGHGASSGLDGDFSIQSAQPIEWLKFSYLGYEVLRVSRTEKDFSKPLRVALKRTSYNISEVVVYPGVNPAHRIIDAVFRNRDSNNPDKLNSYSYTSYNKMHFAFDFDSTAIRKAREQNPSLDTIRKADAALYYFSKKTQEHHAFMMESVSERQFAQPDVVTEKVVATRVSGMKDPMYTFLATQFQSFSFYPEHISILTKSYLNPISKGSTSKYLFLLEDTVYTPVGDTVFVISFRPRKGQPIDGLKGVLSINTDGYAIQSVIAEPADGERLPISLRIQQRYEKVNGQAWFPVELNTDLIYNYWEANRKDVITGANVSLRLLGVGKSYLRDIEINPNLSDLKRSHVELTFHPDAADRGDEYWVMNRKDSLSAIEQRTYRIVDSLSKQANLERKMKLMTALMIGRIPMGYVNLDLTRLAGYNQFEGYRLGLGLETSRKVSEYFRVGGYAAYGFTDKAAKYGGFANITLSKRNQVYLEYAYSNDVRESGSYRFMGTTSLLSSDFMRNISIAKMDNVVQHRVDFGFRAFHWVSFNLFGAQSNHKLLSEYYPYISGNSWYSAFNQTEVGVRLRYAPGEKFMELPSGLMPLNNDFPVLRINLIKGLKALDGTYNYTKVEARYDDTFVWRTLGKTHLSTSAGYMHGDAPASLLYFGVANYLPLSIEAIHGFGAMRMNEFLMDKFVNLFLRHDFGSLLWKTSNKRWQPTFALAQNIAFGDLKSSFPRTFYNGDVVKAPTRGYFESGLLVGGLIPTSMYSIGFGVYYRYGDYAYAKTADNFAYKLTFNYSF